MKNPESMKKIESLLAAQEYYEAFAALDSAIEHYPDDVEYPEVYADTLFRLGLLDLSMQHIENAIRLGSRKVKMHRMKAACLLNQGESGMADQEVARGLALAGNDVMEHSNLLILSAVMKLYAQDSDSYSKASELMDEAERLNPTNPDIPLVRVYMDALSRNIEGFRKFSERLMAESGNEPGVIYLLINAGIRVNDLATAQNLSEKLKTMTDADSIQDYSALLLDYELKKLQGEHEKFFPILTGFITGDVDPNRKINLLYPVLRMDEYRLPVIYSREFVPLYIQLLNEGDPGIPEEIHDYVFNGKFLDSCISRNSGDSVLYMFRSMECIFDGDPEASLEFINKSLEIDENWLNSLIKSIVLMNSEDSSFETAEEADGILKKWEQAEPEIQSIHLLRSIILAFAMGDENLESLDEIKAARKQNPYEYTSVLTDVLIRITKGDRGMAASIIDDYLKNAGINEITVLHQVSMLRAYCMEDVKRGVQYILDLTEKIREKDEFEGWLDMLTRKIKFIPEYLFVESLPVPFFYPVEDPDPSILLDAVKEAVEKRRYR